MNCCATLMLRRATRVIIASATSNLRGCPRASSCCRASFGNSARSASRNSQRQLRGPCSLGLWGIVAASSARTGTPPRRSSSSLLGRPRDRPYRVGFPYPGRPARSPPERFGKFLEGPPGVRDLLLGEVLRDDVADGGLTPHCQSVRRRNSTRRWGSRKAS